VSDLYFGGLFPAPGGTIAVPGVAAELDLSTVTSSGVLDNAALRARIVGPVAYEISLEADASPVAYLDEAGDELIIHVVDNATTMAELAALINADSEYVEMVGTWNPSDIVQTGDDEFSNEMLTGGTGPSTQADNGYWDGHFPFDVEATPDVPPVTPEGAATFALRLEAGTKVTYSWQTDVQKAYGGKEHRACLLDDPREEYAGSAFMAADFALQTRVSIAQLAAAGSVFSLGLPYEETTVSDVSGDVVTVGDPTSTLDWAVKGQRVLVHRGASDDTDVAEAVIQDVGASNLTLDTIDSDACVLGAVIMPLVPVLLEAQQGFPRYRTGCERWSLRARAAVFGYPAAAIAGTLVRTLAGESVTFRAATAGIAVSLSLAISGVGVNLAIAPGDDGDFALAITAASGTTLGALQTALGTSYVLMDDGFDTGATLSAGDAFSLTALSGAEEGGPGSAGLGATVTTFLGRAVWDRGLENAQLLADSVHSMSEIVDFGAVVEGVAEADIPDWGRQIIYTGDDRAAWQWLKAMLGTIRGRWKSFYLPTWRADLEAMGSAGATELTIDADVGSYDLWASRGYDTIQLEQGSVVSYARITGSVNNGDGTITLTISGSGWSLAAVDRVSWCELVRLEADDVEVTWTNGTEFRTEITGRVVQQ
jgi:hypothetical protein